MALPSRSFRSSASFVLSAMAASAMMAFAAGCSGNGSSGAKSGEAPLVHCDGQPTPGPTCPGVPAPAYALEDVQPKSPRFGQTYGLDVFRGRVMVVALLAGWCPFCQSQAAKLEELQAELAKEGKDVAFVTVNKADARDYQAFLTSRCSFPILQDTDAVGAWKLHGGGKDAIYVYDAEGVLKAYFPADDVVNLSDPDGYSELKDAIKNAF